MHVTKSGEERAVSSLSAALRAVRDEGGTYYEKTERR